MKRVGLKLYPILTVIIFLFMSGNSKQAEAASATPILESPDVTIMDGNGQIIGGNKDVNLRNAIPLGYNGKNLVDDIKVLDSSGVLQPNKNGTTVSPYPVGTIFKVFNAGYYDGKPIVFAFKSTNLKLQVYGTTNASGTYVYPYPSGNLDASGPRYEVWVEDLNGNEINDPNVQFIFPILGNYVGASGSYLMWQFIAGGSVQGNLLARNSTKADGIFLKSYMFVDITNSYTNLIATAGSIYVNYLFPANGHVKLYSEMFSGKYPETGTMPAVNNNTYKFLSSDVPTLIQLYNAAPIINSTVNDNTFQANISVGQSLYGQSSDSFYPTSLDINVKVPDVLKTTEDITNIKVLDKNDIDVTSQVSLSSESNGAINISIPKSTLKSLGSNYLKIEGEISVDRTNEKLMNYYDSDTGYFVFSETAKNTDSEKTNNGTAKVKMPGPTADAVPQTVSKGMSTSNLQPKDLVENLSSLIPNDVVSIVGFKESKVFSSLGSDSVVVQIKSEKSGTVSDIIVPITVVSEPIQVDQINMSWELPNPTVVTEKTEELSSSTLNSKTIAKEIYWQSTKRNKQYMLVVKKGSTTIAQTQTSHTSTGENNWVKETINIPTDQLTSGINNLTVIAYAFSSDGKLVGGPLNYLKYNLTVIDDNSELSWNSDERIISKVESLDKSTMEESLVETLYWKTTTEDRNYLLITKDSSGSVVTSQAVSNAKVVNKYQKVTISVPTSSFDYGDNQYTLSIYAKDSAGVVVGEALDTINLLIKVEGTLQLISIPETIDFNLQTIDSRKNVRVDNPTISGDLVIADTRDIPEHKWTVKVSLSKEFINTDTNGKTTILRNVLRYKAPGEEEFIVTSQAQVIAKEPNTSGKYDISSQWGTTKDSAGFKFETPPAYIGQLGVYTGEITYTISETYEP